jgi:hypothetical protein
MSIAGQLLLSRQRITLQPGVPTNIDTGLTQGSLAAQSGDAPVGLIQATPPADGATPASRVMVVPLAPILEWGGVTHGEPYFDTDTNTVHVVFALSSESAQEINVMFWDPHTAVGPVDAETYNEE